MVTVTVRASGFSAPTGKVVVRVGGTVKTYRIKVTHKGRITVTMPMAKKGTHAVRATFTGKTQLTARTSTTLKVKVVRRGRRSPAEAEWAHEPDFDSLCDGSLLVSRR